MSGAPRRRLPTPAWVDRLHLRALWWLNDRRLGR